jgi:hypothetical protein
VMLLSCCRRAAKLLLPCRFCPAGAAATAIMLLLSCCCYCYHTAAAVMLLSCCRTAAILTCPCYHTVAAAPYYARVKSTLNMLCTPRKPVTCRDGNCARDTYALLTKNSYHLATEITPKTLMLYAPKVVSPCDGKCARDTYALRTKNPVTS